jgi:hypothetical protein
MAPDDGAVGLRDRLKALNDPAVKAWRDSEERWAKILEIGPKLGPLTKLRLEIHFSNNPPKEDATTVLVPLGVKPHVGQDVAYHVNVSGDGASSHIVIDWDKPPNYGAPPVDVQELGAEAVAEVMASPMYAQAAEATNPDYQLRMLEQMRDAGQVSAADFERKRADLRRWAEDPERENDPQVHLARLDQQHAAGEVTDAEYTQRKTDLDNWAANLKRLQ